MAKFKALFAHDQFFSVGEKTYRFVNGEFNTEDAEIIAFLSANHGCEKVEEPKTKKASE